MEPLRHACAGCGGSCRGVAVRLFDDEEPGVRGAAEALGVEEPIVGGALRQVDGACVFLGEDARCRIHAAFGAAAKPRICRQYPVVAVRTEAGGRVGLDPGCYEAWRTWRDGPAVELGGLVGGAALLPPDEARAEAAVVAILGVGTTVAAAIARLAGAAPPADGALPAGFAARLRARLVAMPWPALLGEPTGGASLRAALAPVAALAGSLVEDPSRPLPWPTLDTEAEDFAIEATRRAVSLRVLRGTVPGAPPAALLTLCGVVACGWADPRIEAFGPALAAWTRALRAPPFRRALVPDAAAMQALAVGG